MPSIDALVSPTLKHLRERWWNDEFTEFLIETLRPRPGNRILDVGCGDGTAEVSIGRLQLSQVRLVGVDLRVSEVLTAKRETAAHNLRAAFAAGDARRLPFQSAAFDSTYCVALLQHVGDIDAAVAELARVTRPTGRVIVVEPDNSARYAYSSVPTGMSAFAVASQFFAARASSGLDGAEPQIGPRLPAFFTKHGIEPVDVRLFPVSRVQLGTPPDDIWAERRAVIGDALAQTSSDDVRAHGRAYLDALEAYARQAREAGPEFVEIQNTMLFATVGQRGD